MNIWVCNVVVMKMSVHYFLSNQFYNLRKMELRTDFTTSQVLNLQFDDVSKKITHPKINFTGNHFSESHFVQNCF